MILDVETVIKDFKAVVNSIKVGQVDILEQVKEIIDTRVEELKNEGKGNEGEDISKEDTEKGDSEEAE